MRPEQYRTTIERQIAQFNASDRKTMDDCLAMFQGRFWTGDTGQSESELLKTSVNLVFALVETALSTLVPPNPAVTALARSPVDEGAVRSTEALINLALDCSDYRNEQLFLTQDAVMYGRGVAKTMWNPKTDLPETRAVDVRSLFFDLAAKREVDVRYWFEATLLSEDEFRARAKSGLYDKKVANDIQPDAYPKWLLPRTSGLTRDQLKNYQQWVVVYEFYDMDRAKVLHFAAGEERPLMEDNLLYNPYDIVALNNNGEDCRGLSEIALISPNQEEVNWLLTYWLNIVRAAVPHGVYDPGIVDQEQLTKATQSDIGGWSPLRSMNGRPIAEGLAAFPTPAVPTDALALLDKVWSNITIVSALAEAQRGQVTGARTATELALIEGQLRNRLKSRQGRLDRATASIAQKMLFLAKKFMVEDKVVRLTGQEGWGTAEVRTILDAKVKFDVVPYSPMESNRAVVQEQFLQLMQFLAVNPAVDQRKIAEVAVKIFDNPELRNVNIFLPLAPPAPPPGVVPPPPPVGPVDPNLGAAMPPADTAMPAQMADIAANMAPPGGSPKVEGLPVPAPSATA